MGGSKALDPPPPLIILRVFWVGLLPHLLSLVTGALSGCLLVPLSVVSFPRWQVCSRQSQDSWSNGTAADATFSVGGSNPGLLTFGGGGGGGVRFGTGVRTADQKESAALHYHLATLWFEVKFRPTAWGRICHRQKTQTVCFCLTYCWPGAGTEWLTVNLSSRYTAEGNRIFGVSPFGDV